MSTENLEWYVIVARPRSEKAVAQALANKGVEVYLPVYRGRYRSAGRFQDVDLPLFPQYVFCRIGAWSRAYVLSTPGVFRFVVFGNTLAPVSDSELEGVRRATTSGADLQPWPFLKAGDLVEIAEGPFRGLTGRLLTTKGDCRDVYKRQDRFRAPARVQASCRERYSSWLSRNTTTRFRGLVVIGKQWIDLGRQLQPVWRPSVGRQLV